MKSKFMLLASAAAMVPAIGSAQLFSSAFNDATSANSFLTTQIAGSSDTITFGFDYSTRGIAEAPSQILGSAATRGLFIAANKPASGAGAINGINITAASGGVAINFGQIIRMSFDMWINVATDTASSTEQALFGINTDGAGVNSRTGATQTGADGVWYHQSGDGGYGNTSATPNSRDVVNYINNGVAGRLDNTEAPFPTLFPNGTPVGSPGGRWVQVVIEEIGGNVRMSYNGTTVFDVLNTGPTSGSVFIGYQDPFSGSIPTDPQNAFIVFDNLVVDAVPEPATMAILGLGAAALLRRRGR